MAFYKNAGDGTFKDSTESAGLTGQLGGKNLVQTDFNNDGRLDLFHLARRVDEISPIPPKLVAE